MTNKGGKTKRTKGARGGNRKPANQNTSRSRVGETPARVRGPTIQQTLLEAPPLFGASRVHTGMLYYEQDIKLSHATGAKQDYFIFANSLYDPNSTGTGHQPMGFDQLMLYFEHYCVFAARIKADFLNQSDPTGLGASAIVGVYLSPDAVASTDVQKAIENGLIKTTIVGAAGSDSSGVHHIKSVSMDVDVRKYFGRNKNVRQLIEDTDLAGSATASPIEGVYFGITAWGFPQGQDMVLQVAFTVEFDALFYEPRKVSVSFLKGPDRDWETQ